LTLSAHAQRRGAACRIRSGHREIIARGNTGLGPRFDGPRTVIRTLSVLGAIVLPRTPFRGVPCATRRLVAFRHQMSGLPRPPRFSAPKEIAVPCLGTARQFGNFTKGNGTNANLYHFRTFQAAAGTFYANRVDSPVRRRSDIDSSVVTEPDLLQLRTWEAMLTDSSLHSKLCPLPSNVAPRTGSSAPSGEARLDIPACPRRKG
jgi:hypothetical protein